MPRPRLNRSVLASQGRSIPQFPERVLQFGGGAFLRGFVDWMIHRLNVAGRFGGNVVVVQSTGQGRGDELNRQDGLYTLLTRGIEGGRTVDEAEIVTSVSRTIDARSQWADVLAVARSRELKLIVSNTTEAGIAIGDDDRFEDTPPKSFPAKLTAVLFERFNAVRGDRAAGPLILPCELIDDNGHVLRDLVLELTKRWSLPDEFERWVRDACRFRDTLVDRIVPGFPKDDAEQIQQRLGYDDALLDVAEPFHFWAIRGDAGDAAELPLGEIGLNVVWADDIAPYRRRKVRILNGAHTMLAAAGFLAGKDTVRQCVEDDVLGPYIRCGVFDEILPVLDVPESDKRPFAEAVLERFANPFVQHQLLSITLNTSSKFHVRVLPSLHAYIERFGKVPPILSFALAATIAFYRGRRDGKAYEVKDDAAVLERFANYWSQAPADVRSIDDRWVKNVLGDERIWSEDLNRIPSLSAAVRDHLTAILTSGAERAIARLV
jgi:tagaturonate reductase